MSDLASRVAYRFRAAAAENSQKEALTIVGESGSFLVKGQIDARLQGAFKTALASTTSWEGRGNTLTYEGTTTDGRTFRADLTLGFNNEGRVTFTGDLAVMGTASLPPLPKEGADLFNLIEDYFKTLESLGVNMKLALGKWLPYREEVLDWMAGKTTSGKFGEPILMKPLGANIRLHAARYMEEKGGEIRSSVPVENQKVVTDLVVKIKRRMLDLGKIIGSVG